jgi:periplasmic divalent cation tolerance protein
MTQRSIVLMTAGSQEEAEHLAETLVSERLAACVNIVAGATSVYHWEGIVHKDPEWLLIAKTHANRLESLIQRVPQIHNYDLPEVIALPVTGGSEAYLRWIDSEVCGSDAAGTEVRCDHA